MGAWFEDEGFWTAYAPLMFDEKRWAEVPAVVDAIEKLAELEPGDSVLDTCCGVGRHSIELAKRGYIVTGIDLTRPYLEAAAASAEAEDVAPEFVRADVRDFSRPGAFNLALNLFTSFGYFESRSEDLAALRNLRSSLAPGGSLILETIGKETAVRDFTEGEWFERSGWTVLTEFSVVGPWEALRNRWVLLNGAERVDRTFDMRLYSGVEMRSILEEAGFTSIEIFGNLEGAPYDEKAVSLVALASV